MGSPAPAGSRRAPALRAPRSGPACRCFGHACPCQRPTTTRPGDVEARGSLRSPSSVRWQSDGRHHRPSSGPKWHNTVYTISGIDNEAVPRTAHMPMRLRRAGAWRVTLPGVAATRRNAFTFHMGKSKRSEYATASSYQLDPVLARWQSSESPWSVTLSANDNVRPFPDRDLVRNDLAG